MDTFNTKYKVLDKIGEGSFSDVLKCEDKKTGVMYAAKRLKKAYKSESNMINCAEVVASKKIPYHPNISNMLEYHYESFTGQVTFIFEVMDMSLYEYMKKRKHGFSEQKGKAYIFQILTGLDHLQSHGLFHRDVKPENVLIKFPSVEHSRLLHTDRHDIVKLADLGSVRGIYSVPPYTEYISTRWYRSPECLLTAGNYGPKMDVWATGCVFYEILTLMPLFPGSNEIDQLAKIHQILGTPPIKYYNKLKSRSKNCIFFPKMKGSGIDRLLPQISVKGKIILKMMIEYDFDKRSNIRRILWNEYFDDIREKMLNAKLQKSDIWHKSSESIGGKIKARTRSNTMYDRMCDALWKRPKDGRKRESSCSIKSSTHSTEIPYYLSDSGYRVSPKKLKATSLPLVNYKLTCLTNNSPKSSQSSITKTQCVKRTIQTILRTTSDSSGEQKLSKQTVSKRNQFQTKSMIVQRTAIKESNKQGIYVHRQHKN